MDPDAWPSRVRADEVEHGLLDCVVSDCPLYTPRCTVVELTDGASTLYDAQGGAITIHTEHSETFLGAGMNNGRFSFGAGTIRNIRAGRVYLGEQQLRVNAPTDVFDTSHILLGLGVGAADLRAISGAHLRLFGGFSGGTGRHAVISYRCRSLPCSVCTMGSL